MSNNAGTRVIVGMSGGVDSSVAALLLKQQGYDVHGLYMFNWDEDEQGYCTAAEDFQDARRVASLLDIPLHQVNFAAEYRQHVFDVFLEGLQAGLTPNPDVLCNREIKFGRFLDHALRLGASYVATGHYARRISVNGEHQLHRGADRSKDQSYFLHYVSAEALGRTLFPLGETLKSDVRALALEAGLHNSRKRDSTGICFIGERPFQEFLASYLPVQPGEIRTPEGQAVGEHCGLAFYTLGQRQGLGIGGVRGASDEPWYVAGKDDDNNVLIVVQGHDHPLLYSSSLEATAVHWINGCPAAGELSCQVSTRYRQRPAPAAARLAAGTAHVEFASPQWAVTPGQHAVFYDGERCLGGGIISAAAATGVLQTAV
ncbi:MAG: tRNA 2-thiouridine(34) synthase MnmA [Gammaproteobacteria bacterium]|nr:tRNA 2-thiouridine(34) synthase MnmA [Gammaproteobacteria bacterium]NNF61291.1 tRNA 2-thiouridine(34) synthase MnmA [Gammaproteobacteria bacterium]